ncbi:MAG: hypothetical protein J6K30_09230 [Oscillospiraceae bacterium]|nr:hypothetical protein [Oscillospiraceae bacterium]
MSNEIIKRLPLCEKNKVVDFLNEHWGSRHPLVNNEQLFNYYYVDGDMTNFYYLEDDGEIAAVCGYIKCSEKPDSDIWISIWCAKKGKNGLGLALMGKMQELTGARVMSCNNIRKNTMAFYTFLGYHPDEMKHYYRLRDLSEYKMAVVNNKNIPLCPAPSTQLVKFDNIEQIKAAFNNFDSCKPQKDYWYVDKRYFRYPHYEYKVYGIYKDGSCDSLVVFRVNESDEGYVLRVVDYIGSPENICDLNGHIDALMEQFDCEFCDMYCFGADGTKAGFVLRDKDDTNIIPNYLNTLLQQNIDYYFFTTDTDSFLMFKADGDQDRKNLG